MLLAFHRPIYGYCSHIETSQWFVNDFDDLFVEWLTDESVSNLISNDLSMISMICLQNGWPMKVCPTLFPARTITEGSHSSRTSGKTQKGFGPAQKLILDPFE